MANPIVCIIKRFVPNSESTAILTSYSIATS